VINQS